MSTTTRSTLFGYGIGGTGHTDDLITMRIGWGSVIKGTDSFKDLCTFYIYSTPAILQTGAIKLVPDGYKASVKQLYLKTYTEGTTMPDVVVQIRKWDSSSWVDGGNTKGTITVTTSACTGSGTAFSDAEPYVPVKVNDYILTSYGWHRVTVVTDDTHLTLEWYPLETGASVTGTHHPAKQLTAGDTETYIGIGKMVDTMEMRVIVLPRTASDACTVVKVVDIGVDYDVVGPRMKETS